MELDPERMQGYEIVKHLGQGNYGSVCLVRNLGESAVPGSSGTTETTGTKGLYAMKLVPLGREAQAAHQEVLTQRRIRHPNVLQFKERHAGKGVAPGVTVTRGGPPPCRCFRKALSLPSPSHCLTAPAAPSRGL